MLPVAEVSKVDSNNNSNSNHLRNQEAKNRVQRRLLVPGRSHSSNSSNNSQNKPVARKSPQMQVESRPLEVSRKAVSLRLRHLDQETLHKLEQAKVDKQI